MPVGLSPEELEELADFQSSLCQLSREVGGEEGGAGKGARKVRVGGEVGGLEGEGGRGWDGRRLALRRRRGSGRRRTRWWGDLQRAVERLEGHEATETGLAYAPVSQAHGHNHIVQCFAVGGVGGGFAGQGGTGGEERGVGVGGGRRRGGRPTPGFRTG